MLTSGYMSRLLQRKRAEGKEGKLGANLSRTVRDARSESLGSLLRVANSGPQTVWQLLLGRWDMHSIQF